MTDEKLRERLMEHAGHYKLTQRLDAMVQICKTYAADLLVADANVQFEAMNAHVQFLQKEIAEKEEQIKEASGFATPHLETLIFVRLMFDVHSDHSSRCNGYHSLLNMIELAEKNRAESRSPKNGKA